MARAFLAPLETVHGLSLPRAAIQIRLTSMGRCTSTFAIPLLPHSFLPFAVSTNVEVRVRALPRCASPRPQIESNVARTHRGETRKFWSEMRDTYLGERLETKADPFFAAARLGKPILRQPPGPTNSRRPSNLTIPSIIDARHAISSSGDFNRGPETLPSGLANAENGSKRSR